MCRLAGVSVIKLTSEHDVVVLYFDPFMALPFVVSPHEAMCLMATLMERGFRETHDSHKGETGTYAIVRFFPPEEKP